LSNFLKEHLVDFDPSTSSIRSDIQADSLEDGQKSLKSAFELMKFGRANLLAKNIVVGLWLEKSYEIFHMEKRNVVGFLG